MMSPVTMFLAILQSNHAIIGNHKDLDFLCHNSLLQYSGAPLLVMKTMQMFVLLGFGIDARAHF